MFQILSKKNKKGQSALELALMIGAAALTAGIGAQVYQERTGQGKGVVTAIEDVVKTAPGMAAIVMTPTKPLYREESARAGVETSTDVTDLTTSTLKKDVDSTTTLTGGYTKD